MTLLDFPDETTDASAHHLTPGQWRLARIEILNWGTFDGHSTIDVARQGHLITGASGSGKSSLLDAVAAVLTPDKWLRFNAAAQDSSSRNDDRSLISYIRGAWSKEADEQYDRAVSAHLRKGATWSGILLRYENLRDAPVTLVRLFHLRGSSVDRNDLRDACIIERGDVTLLDYADHVASGIEARRIKAQWPEARVTTNGSHGPFYARLRSLFGMRNDNTLHLLHKTQSAKNLGSLDQLFRAFMLDEPATFARARNAVDQFGELRDAHQHVVELRQQVDALGELDLAITEYESAAATEAEAQRLGALIDDYQAALTAELAADERQHLRSQLARAESELRAAETRRDDARERHLDAQLRIRELGVDTARAALEQAKTEADATARRWRELAATLNSVDIAGPDTAEEFAELRASSERELDTPLQAARHDTADTEQLIAARREIARIDRELAELRQRRSNLPVPLLVARSALAEQLGLTEAALPFAGELIEVRPEHAEWTGAIERVLYPIASALLVRDEHLAAVRRHVEGRHLGARLVFEAVPPVADAPRPARSERSLLHRIRFADGPFAEWLSGRVAAEFDYDCVDHPDELDRADRGVTIGGQLKKSARRYEKNDRYTIDDRSKWILGSDNADKIDALLQRRQDAVRRKDEADARLNVVAAGRDAAIRRRTVLETLVTRNWNELDRIAADERVRVQQQRLDELTRGNKELQRAVDGEQAAREALESAEQEAQDCALTRAGLAKDLAEVEAIIDRYTEVSIAERDSAALEKRYRSVQRKIDRRNVEAVGRKVSDALHRDATAAQARSASAQQTFVAGASRFAARWPATSANLTATIEDRAGYRTMLSEIQARGLPEHEGNFLRLLRERSHDLVGHLLAEIRDAPKRIEERIVPVNASLGRSMFDVDRYLRIDVKVRRSGEVTEFMADLRTIVDGAWDDSLDDAERRFAVLNRVMARLASSEHADIQWRRRCLDTREHVTFMAHEVDLGGHVVGVHDSSAGLSGGQRQKLVIFCLAAALRYQLADDEQDMPQYATIILDEAFDKADSRYTRMAMDVFVEFGFHMILATPQKLLQTIEPYVGALTAIENPSRKQSLITGLTFREANAIADTTGT